MGLKKGLSCGGAGGGWRRWRTPGSQHALGPLGPRAVRSEAHPRSGQQLVAVPVCAARVRGPMSCPVPLPVSVTHSCLEKPCKTESAICSRPLPRQGGSLRHLAPGTQGLLFLRIPPNQGCWGAGVSLAQVCHLCTAVPIFRPDLCPRRSCDVDTLPHCPQPLPHSHHLSVLGLLSLVLGLPSSPNSILAMALITSGRLSRFPAPHCLHGHVSNDLFFFLLQLPHPPTAAPQTLHPLESPGAGLQPPGHPRP